MCIIIVIHRKQRSVAEFNFIFKDMSLSLSCIFFFMSKEWTHSSVPLHICDITSHHIFLCRGLHEDGWEAELCRTTICLYMTNYTPVIGIYTVTSECLWWQHLRLLPPPILYLVSWKGLLVDNVANNIVLTEKLHDREKYREVY